MKATLKLDRNMRLIGTNHLGLETAFDTHPDVGGEDSAPTPMEIVLEAAAACSVLDVLSILRKKKKTIDDLKVYLDSERATDHPKIFKKIHMIFELTSPNAELSDLERCIELSQEKYCSVSAMIKLSGCEITWEGRIIKS